MTPQQFIAKWQRANLSERSACQQHFLDLCDLLGQAKPAAADPDGAWYAFERGVRKTSGGNGWADVWMRGHFGWEYKGPHKDLADAYQQLLEYREALENPPLLVVCDLDRFEIHTNFTNTTKRVYAFDLEGLGQPANLDILRKLFAEPEALHPQVHAEAITKDAAERFGDLAERLWMRKEVSPQRAAHFLMKLMFCMFGEDIGLLPPKLFGKLLESAKANPAMLARRLEGLFKVMATGGDFGADAILWFNGGLFADSDVISLKGEEINILASVNQYDWANVEPSIFGTLFQRTLDPGKRSQIGAHYTSETDIRTLLEPVLMAPLRREWDEVRRRCEEELWPKVQKGGTGSASGTRKESKARKTFDRALLDFAERLHHVTVFDPACGSGNFLYVAIKLLLDLEKEVIGYAAAHGLALVPHVEPTQLAGLEINPYAQQLAQVVLWIGYLQWMHHNGFRTPDHPVLQPIENIRCQDAILDLSDPKHPKEPEWPAAEFIVGNPPFLGGNKIRGELGDEYVEHLFSLYEGRLPAFSDLCCYWFEKGRQQIERARASRVGLLATQGIRGGANREVLHRIKQSGDIFFAESDRDWVLDGASVHVSMIGFDAGNERTRLLDAKVVSQIYANLTACVDTAQAKALAANIGMCFMGASKKASFDINDDLARRFLLSPNPDGRPNSDVVRPWSNALDLTRRPRSMWIVDFGNTMELEDVTRYADVFDHMARIVKPERENRRERRITEYWWRFGRPRVEMRRALTPMTRFVATPALSKHRLCVWMPDVFVPDQQLLVFARCDDSFFGVLHSRIHDVWALRQGTQLETRPRYTPTSCFETFPLPECVWGDGGDGGRRTSRLAAAGTAALTRHGPTCRRPLNDSDKRHAERIAAAARELDELRNRWLNPPEWTKTEVLEFPGSVDGPWARYIDPGTVRPHPNPLPKGEGTSGSRPHPNPLPEGEGTDLSSPGIGTVRWPRLVPKDPDCAESLKKRTLTNLYNQRPAWLELAHQKLDAAVFAAYGWDPASGDEELLAKLLALNLERAGRKRTAT